MDAEVIDKLIATQGAAFVVLAFYCRSLIKDRNYEREEKRAAFKANADIRKETNDFMNKTNNILERIYEAVSKK